MICFVLLGACNCMGMYSHKSSMIKKIFGAFNPLENYRNMQIIRECQKGQLDLRFLCGIKTIGTCMVLLGHSFFISTLLLVNIIEASGVGQGMDFVFVYNLMYCLDIFFFLGGFYMAWTILGKELINRSVGKYFLMILSRYLRFVPLLFFILIFHWQFSVHLTNGPQWYFMDRHVRMCDNMW